MQNDNTCTLSAMQQAQFEHANDSQIDDIPTFYGTPNKHFEWYIKWENIVNVTKCDPKELAIGKGQYAVIKCLRSLPPDASWNE